MPKTREFVKLHGTLGDTSPLIFAEQDYRTYPTDYPAFVNFARQVFIENELCLIGFSGDDPNFLQWSGWVRDQLKSSTRRIYLVGYLNLAPATRRYFEAHNIAPVDFAPILKEIPEKERHAEAARLFFEALRSAEPRPGHEWALANPHDNPAARDMARSDRIRKDVGFAVEVLEEITKVLREDRYAYPGWVVCPRSLRSQLKYLGAEQWVWRKEVLDAIPPVQRAPILYELVWRRTISFSPLEEPLEKAVAELLASDPKDVDGDLLGELALGLMRLARASDNEDSFKVWSEYLEARVRKGAALHLAAQYQRCLRARDLLDYVKVVELVDGLQSDEPDWQMRRAALLAEAGQTQRAEELFRGAEF